MTGEYVCSDCGSDLTKDDHLNSVCGDCGAFNPITRSDYQDADLGGVRELDSDGVEGLVLTPECGPMGGWIQAKNPYTVRQ